MKVERSQIQKNEVAIFKVVRCATSKISRGACGRVHQRFCRSYCKLLGDAAMSENEFLYFYAVLLLDGELFW